tara:strand:+ start:279 stop:464 length:186 start_codon:yes stop_codon:yes gene_type:complete
MNINDLSISQVIRKQLKEGQKVRQSKLGEVNYITQPRTNVDIAKNGDMVVAPNSQYKRRFS